MSSYVVPNIPLDPTELMKQACLTAHDYMMHAVNDVEQVFGKNLPPEAKAILVAAYMNSATVDFAASSVAQQVRQPLEFISESIDGLAHSMGALGDSLNPRSHG